MLLELYFSGYRTKLRDSQNIGIIDICGIKSAIGKDRAAVYVFDDRGFLVIINASTEDHLGMIIDNGADIALYHLPARADGELHDVLDIRLRQLHPVSFTEAPR